MKIYSACFILKLFIFAVTVTESALLMALQFLTFMKILMHRPPRLQARERCQKKNFKKKYDDPKAI